MKEEFRVFGRPETALPFAVEMAGISYCDGSYRIDRPHSPITVMEYVIRGQGTLQTRGRTFTAKGGDVYILHRGDSHLYYADPRDPWIKLFFNVSGPLPEQLLEAYHLDGETLLPGCPVEGLFRDFFRLARLEEPADAFRQCALKFHEIAAAVSAARREDRPRRKRCGSSACWTAASPAVSPLGSWRRPSTIPLTTPSSCSKQASAQRPTLI